MAKKYDNPISKPQTVMIYTWEYRALVEKATKLEILFDMAQKSGNRYQTLDVIDAMIRKTPDAEGSEDV